MRPMTGFKLQACGINSCRVFRGFGLSCSRLVFQLPCLEHTATLTRICTGSREAAGGSSAQCLFLCQWERGIFVDLLRRSSGFGPRTQDTGSDKDPAGVTNLRCSGSSHVRPETPSLTLRLRCRTINETLLPKEILVLNPKHFTRLRS